MLKILEVKIYQLPLTLVNYLTLLIIKYLKIHNLLYPNEDDELLQDFLNLDINKSTGTDNTGPTILKVGAPFIVSPLTYIFNRIIDSSIYPNILKKCKSVSNF